MNFRYQIELQANMINILAEEDAHKYMADLMELNNYDENTWSLYESFSEDFDIVYETEFARHGVEAAFGLQYTNRYGETNRDVLAGVAYLLPKFGTAWKYQQALQIAKGIQLNGRGLGELFSNVVDK